MGSYERSTAATTKEILREAELTLTERLPLKKIAEDKHSITLEGGDGKVKISAHRHGLSNMIFAETDQLSTSRLDLDVQYVMSRLPYEPGDVVVR